MCCSIFLEHRPLIRPTGEADEAYVGGRRRNMPRSKRRQMRDAGPLAGKTVVAGVKDRRSNRVSAGVVEDRVIPDAKVYTDEHTSYRGLIFHDHETVNHSLGQYTNPKTGAGTQGIESFWSMLKRAYIGTFHHFSAKHTDRYVTEFARRHNAREADTLVQMGAIARGMMGRRLKYADLIR